MGDFMSKTVHYLGYYVAEAQRKKLTLFPSCFSKIEYVASKLEQLGARVRLVSAASALKGRIFGGGRVKLSEQRTLRYFSSFGIKGALFRKLNVVWLRFQLLLYILFCVKKQDVLLVYHSLFYAPVLKFAKKYLGKKFVLEIEDVYSSVTEGAKSFKTYEWDFFKYAESYLCVNDILAKKLPAEKRKIVSYGNYSVYPNLAQPDDEYIRLVYAGVIESYRGAAFMAVEIMQHLDAKYRLDVMGFGSEAEVEKLKQQIQDMNAKKGYECVRFLGMLQGEEYYTALQSCHIALSTHKYDAENMESADHTFPSKLLVYLGNNLRIVAQEIPCLTKSKLKEYITFYPTADSTCVAKTIQGIPLKSKYCSTEFIKRLDVDFLETLNKLLLK